MSKRIRVSEKARDLLEQANRFRELLIADDETLETTVDMMIRHFEEHEDSRIGDDPPTPEFNDYFSRGDVHGDLDKRTTVSDAAYRKLDLLEREQSVQHNRDIAPGEVLHALTLYFLQHYSERAQRRGNPELDPLAPIRGKNQSSLYDFQ